MSYKVSILVTVVGSEEASAILYTLVVFNLSWQIAVN